ncbi:hypothetical protein IQ249_10990 [Lusitaniella coriacea LEGE 07157]|uniref:Uncharacterized protein n=1 Tax=Lusitaniella coriacea LEGE 07157 TaxID=945747 RepID=A0A8J7JAA7_9CYAN|nr:hypothetical protein [Lusitaniella coriacea]MBE9116425.1 hypothetical protein [Lusitaniella coriacea LEGE 07157]
MGLQEFKGIPARSRSIVSLMLYPYLRLGFQEKPRSLFFSPIPLFFASIWSIK